MREVPLYPILGFGCREGAGTIRVAPRTNPRSLKDGDPSNLAPSNLNPIRPTLNSGFGWERDRFAVARARVEDDAEQLPRVERRSEVEPVVWQKSIPTQIRQLFLYIRIS